MTAPGWYRDPNGQLRWWDGQRWTEHVQQGPPPAPTHGQPAPTSGQPPTAGGTGKSARGCLIPGLIVAGVLIAVLVVAGVVVGTRDDDDSSPTTTTGQADDSEAAAPASDCAAGDGINDTRNLCLYPDRMDRQDNDHEAELGSSVRLAGYTATLLDAFMDQPEFGSPVLVVDVEVENRDDTAQPFNLFDWRILTAAGTVLDPTINLRDDSLSSGSLVSGGTARGTIAFDVDPGEYYVIYKPDPFNDARGIWRINV